MSEKTCSTCIYFKQHYGLNGKQLFRLYCGHCTYQRIKHKHPHTRSCEKYIRTESDENAFVSKEYLSRKLLDYVLSLELLPQINDTSEDESKL